MPAKQRIFFATLVLQKSIAKTTYCLGKDEKFHALARIRTHDLLTGRQTPCWLSQRDEMEWIISLGVFGRIREKTQHGYEFFSLYKQFTKWEGGK